MSPTIPTTVGSNEGGDSASENPTTITPTTTVLTPNDDDEDDDASWAYSYSVCSDRRRKVTMMFLSLVGGGFMM